MADGLETALAATEAQLDGALKAAATLTRELKKAKAAAARGQLRELRRGLATATSVAADAARAAEIASSSFDLDDQAHLASGGFAEELLAEAAAQGVAMFESDDRLSCYPSLIRVLPNDAAVEIDRRRERRLRPSVLVAALGAAQAKPPRFKPAPFLQSLAAAYDLLRARDQQRPGTVVKLVDVWTVLTLLAGEGRDYSRPEFARDLYLLDSNGARESAGRTLRWHASTGTKGAGSLTTVAKTGQQQLYWGISFVPSTS